MPATYEPIATQTLASAAATITFSSIPATYTDLRLVLVVNGFTGAATFTPLLRFNGSSGGTEHSETNMYGEGASAISVRNTSDAYISLATGSSISSTVPTLIELDVFSYAGSTNKTVLINYSNDRNGSGETGRIVGLKRNTAAINAINLGSSSAASYAIGTTATLYGIKAA